MERLPFLKAQKALQPLLAVSVGLLVLALCMTTNANLFLGAFCAGITMASHRPEVHQDFEQFGELVSEILKLAAILVFGALMTPSFLFQEIPVTGWIFSVLALVVARPVALFFSFLGSKFPAPEQIAAMWFGPKGFASVVYGLIVLESDIDQAATLFHLVALIIFISILAHSSTDVVVAKKLGQRQN